jgi:hypothetical protein
MEFDNEDIYHLPHSGHEISPLRTLDDADLLNFKNHGTTIQFYPDFSIMEKCN